MSVININKIMQAIPLFMLIIRVSEQGLTSPTTQYRLGYEDRKSNLLGLVG